MRNILVFAIPFLLASAVTDAASPQNSRLTLLDAALAQSLKDPQSAQQYSVGAFRACDGLTARPMGAYAEGCICYALNAKNSYGGYAGVHYGVATFSDDRATIRAETELTYNFEDTCKADGMTKRDPKLLAQ